MDARGRGWLSAEEARSSWVHKCFSTHLMGVHSSRPSRLIQAELAYVS